uniref:Uncharacterized protein n=1 Tax=Balaenoptera musculus TaxID=9771 RepID=A0A8C0DMT2_BALMU
MYLLSMSYVPHSWGLGLKFSAAWTYLLWGIKFTLLFQAKFWCGVNAGYILFFYILENKIALI